MGWADIDVILKTNRFLYPLLVIVITAISATIASFVFKILKKHLSRKKHLKSSILSVIETPLIIVIVLSGIEFAIRYLLEERTTISNTILTIIIILTTYIGIKLSSRILIYWSTQMSRTKGEEFHTEILPLLRSIITIILTLLGVILILPVWKVNISTFLTSLGVIGVILGFAFQQTFANIFGGISLIMDNSFHKGDLIQLDDSEIGEIGEIMEINLRSTRIKNFDSETIIVPNGKLANTKFINMALPTPTVRIKIPVSVAYGSDVDKVKAVLHDALRNHPDILTMPRRTARMVSFGDNAINFELYFYINDYRKLWQIKDEVYSQIYKDFYAHKIEIPFPIRTIVSAGKKQYDPKWDVQVTIDELEARKAKEEESDEKVDEKKVEKPLAEKKEEDKSVKKRSDKITTKKKVVKKASVKKKK